MPKNVVDRIKRFNAIEQGKNDWHRGVSFEANPHTLGDLEEYGWWELGWLKAYYFYTSHRDGEA